MSDIHGLASLIIGKHRHGSTGTVHVEFEGCLLNLKIYLKINTLVI